MTNDTTKLEITLVSEPNTQAGVLKRMNTPLPIENAIATSEENHPSRELFNVVINELVRS